MPCKLRKFVVTTGVGPSHNLGVYNNNVDNVERALTERYFLCKDGAGFRPAFDVAPRAYEHEALREFRQSVLKSMPRLPRLTRQQVVDCYRGPKRRVYQAALEELATRELAVFDSYVNMFVKFEKQDTSKAARGINPRNATYNLELGRYLKHAEHHFFDAIHKAFRRLGDRSTRTVIKGVNADESAKILRAKWDIYENPVAVGLDASKFDMHVSDAALKYEHSYYTGLFPRESKLRAMLALQRRTKGYAFTKDGSVKFEIEATRCSGDLNTSLGNCLLMCSLVYAYALEKGVRLSLANNGDDCVVFMEKRDLKRFEEGLDKWFKGMGFAMTVEPPVCEFEQLEFCQTHPVELSSGWRMVRNQSAVLTKDPMCLIPINTQRDMKRWFGAVGECGGILAQGVPVQESFYGMYSNAGTKDFSQGLQNHIYRGTTQYQRIEALSQAHIDARARVSYYYAFGVLPDEQIRLEEYYRKLVIADVDLKVVPRESLEFPGDNITLTL